MIEAAIYVVFPLCMAVVIFSDMVSMTIPNRVSVILLAAFVAIAPLAGLGWATIGLHLAAGLAVFAACFALFALNVMGGGDAKVLTAAAVWFGLGHDLMTFLVYVAMLGGVLTLAVVVMRAMAASVLFPPIPLPVYLADRSAGVPYGVAIGIGGFLAYPQSVLMQQALSVAG